LAEEHADQFPFGKKGNLSRGFENAAALPRKERPPRYNPPWIPGATMPTRRQNSVLAYLAAMSLGDLCRQYWQHYFDAQAQRPARQSAFARRLMREAYDELASRLGPDSVQSALDDYTVGTSPTVPAATPSPRPAKPQRVRAPRVMYIEQKYAGNRSLNDSGPAEIGEVSFSRTGRTLYYKGKTFHRERSAAGNYRCLEDGNAYWITGVKKRGTNRHWAGSGPITRADNTPKARP
jgi:hypothetical protein